MISPSGGDESGEIVVVLGKIRVWEGFIQPRFGRKGKKPPQSTLIYRFKTGFPILFRRYSVAVSTEDSDSFNLSSNLGSASFFFSFCLAGWNGGFDDSFLAHFPPFERICNSFFLIPRSWENRLFLTGIFPSNRGFVPPPTYIALKFRTF